MPVEADKPGNAVSRINRLPAQRSTLVGSAQDAPSQFNVSELLRIALKWRWLILGTFLAGALVALLVTLAMTPLYRATATLEVSADPGEVTGRSAEAPQPRQDPDQYLRTQYGLLRSHTLAERVARTVNLTADPGFVGERTGPGRLRSAANKVAANLEVIPQPGSNLIQIAYTDPSPGRAARIVNAIADGYIASNLERRYNATAYARRFLQTRLAAIRTKLEASEAQLVAYARSRNIVQLGSGDSGANQGDSLAAQSLVALNQTLAQATAARIAAEQQYRSALASRTTQQVLGNSTVQQLRTERAQVQAEYDQKLATFKPGLPEMVALRSRMDSIDRNIRAMSQDVTGSLRSAYREAAAREGELRGQIASLRGDVLDMRSRSIQYNILERDFDTNRTLYDALLQRFKEIGVAGGVGESQASIVDGGDAPGAPYSPVMLLNLLIGMAGGLTLGIAAAFGIEFIDDTIKRPEDVLEKLHMPLLGLVPKIGKDTTVPEQLDQRRSPMSESYLSITNALQFSSGEGGPRTIVVTSTRAAEGKTSTSLALARNFARVGQSTLLIDGDLRKPSFKAAKQAGGLTALLMNTAPLMTEVTETSVENLTLLPGGAASPNPAELLSTGRIAQILREASELFDVVVIDAPPVLGLADAPILASVGEVTVMVTRSGVPRRAVLNSLRRLQEARANVTGVILTMFNSTAAGYGYGYGYGDAYGYGEEYGADAGRRPLIELG